MAEVVTTKSFDFQATGVDPTLSQLRRVKTELSTTLTFSTQLINTLTILGLPKELRETVRFLQKISLAANLAAAGIEAFRAAMTGDPFAAARAAMYAVNATATVSMMMME